MQSCKSCEFLISEYTSIRASENSERPSFDTNRQIVKAFSDMGKGYAAMETFSLAVNI